MFVCSDEQLRINVLRYEFGKKVIFYDSIRSKTESPLHYYKQYKYSPSKIGEDVIIEAYILSKCNFLLCCPQSNVNFLACHLNENINYKAIN
jgi:hypothetical protein